MEDLTFFISYARLDLDRNVRKFYQDLVREVRALSGSEAEDPSKIGFIDFENINLGDEWPEKLRLGIHCSRTLVPLYSPTYFRRHNCGKEFGVFAEPSSVYTGQSLPEYLRRPRSILPILWYPLLNDQFPSNVPSIADVQYKKPKGDFPDSYLTKGLQFLMTSGSIRDYRTFLRSFAERLVRKAAAEPIRTVDDAKFLVSLRSITPAFPVASAPQPYEQKRINLRVAKFVFVAAKTGEVNRAVDAYGQSGGLDWKPCAPQDDHFVATIVQDAARLEEFISEPLRLDANLSQTLKQALAERAVVVVLVDPWSLTLPTYQQLLANTKGWSVHSEVIIPLNELDPETGTQLGDVASVTKNKIPQSAIVKLPRNSGGKMPLSEQLRDEVRIALTRAHMRLLQEEVSSLPPTGDPMPMISNA